MTLWDLWYLSLGLALASVGVMLLLVLRRIIARRAERRHQRLRAAASAALLNYIEGQQTAESVLTAAGGRCAIVGDLIFEMRELIRGDGAARCVELATACGGLELEKRRLRSRNPAVRADAVRRLGIYGREGMPLLTAALRDANPVVRTTAAIELTALDAAPDLRTLADLMHVGIDAYSEEQRRVFRRAVAREPGIAMALLEDEWTGDALRILLLDGLGRSGAFEALKAIGAMTQNASPDVRIEGLRALAYLGHPAAADIAVEALGDPDWRVRTQAANCLRRIGAETAAAPLEPLLDDAQWWVRFRAAEALSTFGGDGRRRLKQTAERDDRAGEIARQVLAERGLT